MKEQKFTIGQVEKITGISKDRLRNYDKKRILAPTKQEDNQYRNYGLNDIIEIMGIEYLRTMDIGLTEIKDVREAGDISQLSDVLQKKEQDVSGKIKSLLKVQEMLQKAQAECKRIKSNRNCFSIAPMPAFQLLGTLSETTSFDEYEQLRKDKNMDSPILKSIMRKLSFSEKGIHKNEVLIIDDFTDSQKVLYPKCLYTIIEERIGDSDVSADIFAKSMQWIEEHGYDVIGEAYIKPLIISYPRQELICYLEIYIPIK